MGGSPIAPRPLPVLPLLDDEENVEVVHTQRFHQPPPHPCDGLPSPRISRDMYPRVIPQRRASSFWEKSSRSSNSHTAAVLTRTRDERRLRVLSCVSFLPDPSPAAVGKRPP